MVIIPIVLALLFVFLVYALDGLGTILAIAFFIGFGYLVIKEWIKEAPERKKRKAEEKKQQEKERKRREEQFRHNSSILLASALLDQNRVGYTGGISSSTSIDTNRLRKDMMDYYGTAMHSGSPMAQADLIHVQRASDAELI